MLLVAIYQDLCKCTDNTNILVVVRGINVFEVETALVIKQLEAWLFDNELVFNTVHHVLYYFIPASGNVLINKILCTRIWL